MIAADAVVLWQLRQLAAQTETLNTADKASSAILRLHLDVSSFSGKVAVLTRSHKTRQFVNEAAAVRETFLRHVRDAEQALSSSPEIAQDGLISSTLKTLKTTLPSQIDSEIELANAGDWPAIQLRLTGQVQDLIDLSSSLVEGVEERVFHQRAKINEETERVRRRLFMVVPVAWLLTLLAAAALGWYVTQSITGPLAELALGAEALARGDFLSEVRVDGNDELAVVGRAFNYAARELRELYEKLRDSEEQWRAAFASNPTMYFIVDSAGTIVSVNAFGAEQLGYSEAELQGRPILHLFHEADQEPIHQHAQECFGQPGQTLRWEARGIRKNDKTLWVRATAKAVFLKKRAVLLMVCEDITQQKLAEGAARRSEEELREVIETLREQASLLNLTHDAIYVRDLKGVVQYWNRSAEVLYGWPEANAVGKVAHELLKTVFPLSLEQIEAELLRTGGWEGELVKTRKAGTQLVVASRWSLKRDDAGEPIATLVTSNDITQRKRAEESLAFSSVALNNVRESAFLVDEKSHIHYVNEEACRALGYSREELLGKCVQDVDPDFRMERWSDHWAAVKLNHSLIFESRHRAKDGRVFPVELNSNYFEYGGKAYILGLARDISERKRAEEATLEARVSERTRIARELHDTLLQSFHGLLLRFKAVSLLLPKRPMEAKNTLDSAIKRAAEAIAEGRDAVQGLRESTVEGNDLAQALRSLGEELANATRNQAPVGFHVSVEGEPRNLHPIVRDEIYKISAEAMRNAFRHADAKHVAVAVHYENEQIRLRVRDDGKGIDAGLLSRNANEGHYGIPGMRERAAIMGGNLELWSEVGGGTEVELCVPASKA
jgi:PAS domain S-box-containing protein